MNISEPIPAETPKQITVLESAMIAIGANAETGSKMVYLSPAQAELLFLHIHKQKDDIERLEAELLARDDILIGVAHGDQYEIASLGWHKYNSGKRYEKLAVEK